MASSYTPAGIELIATGEQSGTWGDTTNTNWELIEELATGLVSIALTSTTYSLAMTNGTSSEGRHAIVKFTGTPGGECTVTVTPADMQKIYWVVNSANQNVVISQGGGADVTVPAGTKKALYCDGAGLATAAVIDLFENVEIKDLYLTGSLFIDDTEVTATAAELNVMDGDTAATSTTLADADRVVVNDNGTMKQVALTDFETYFESALDTLSNVTTVGALNSGSITSNFGTINTGSSDITTSGTVSFGSLTDGTITVTAFVDEDTMASDSATLIPTQQSVKAYVDSQVATVDTLSEVLGNGNTSGSTDLVIDANQKITTDTIDETTSEAGVTVDGLLIKDTSAGAADASGTDIAGSQVTIKGGASTGAGVGGSIVFQTTPAGSTGTDVNTQVTAMTIDSTGDVTLTGDLKLGDSDKAIFGANSDLQIYHDGTDNYIHHVNNTGTLRLKTVQFQVLSQATGDVLIEAYGSSGGKTILYHNGTDRVTAHSLGVDIRGPLDVSGGITAIKLNPEDASGTDTAGTDLTIKGGAPTGAGDVGKILFNVTNSSGISGDFVQTATTQVMEINADGIDVTGTSTLDAVNATGDVDITGGVDITGDVAITGEIKADSYNESYSVLSTTGAVTVDCETGNTFMCDMTGNVTFTFSNPPASGTGYTMTIELIQDSTARTVTWPTSVDWPSGTAPTLSPTSGAVDMFVFTTRNGGTTWYGFTAGQAIA